MSELTRRVLFGIPAAAFFLYLIWHGGVVFQVFTALLAFIVLLEMTRLFDKMGHPAVVTLAVLTGIYFWVVTYLPVWMVVSLSALLILFTAWALFNRGTENSGQWLSTIFCGLYAPVGFFFFHEVRMIEPANAGLWFTYALILMIWGNDIFAYFGGRSFGKRPLAPKISPNKTWEGFWSGLAGAIFGLLIIYLIADPFPLDIYQAIPMALLVSLFGPAGDLSESRLKRLAGVKDSSNLLPGHGGFFDRFDALILCAPVIYLYLNWIY